ncbi:MAG: FUSC family protein [Nocardioidaceae bacterium]|nr:FUSC family protein [Nocardioidaceae bacterium]
MRPADARVWVRDRTRDPVVWAALVQTAKAVAAAVIAWLLAVHVFDLAQPFLAPWSALLVVHATAYRTLSRGLQQVLATVVGVLLAFGIGGLLGVGAFTLTLVLAVALLLGKARPWRDEGVTAATTALVVLLTGYSDNGAQLLERLADTGVGIAVGLVVNLIVWAPLHDRSAARRVNVIDDRIGELLTDIARGLRTGADDDLMDAAIERTRWLDEQLDGAWADVRQARESGRFNPRRSARSRAGSRQEWEAILRRLEQAIAEIRSMARTLGRAGQVEEWDPRFGDPWLTLLERTGEAVTAADPVAIAEVKRRLPAFAAGLADQRPHEPGGALTSGDPRWPLYGALLVNLRNITGAMDDVAAAQPVTTHTSVGVV